ELLAALLGVLAHERDRLLGDLLEALGQLLALRVGEGAEALLHEARQVPLEVLGLAALDLRRERQREALAERLALAPEDGLHARERLADLALALVGHRLGARQIALERHEPAIELALIHLER